MHQSCSNPEVGLDLHYGVSLVDLVASKPRLITLQSTVDVRNLEHLSGLPSLCPPSYNNGALSPEL